MTETERVNELTARAQKGGFDAAEAFEELYATYGKRVYYFCECLLGEEEAAVDATRSVFLYAWRNIRSMPAEQTFYPWVCGNAFYFAKIALAGLRGSAVTVEEVDGDPSLLDEISRQPSQTAAEINVRRTHLDAVTELLNALPDGERICVLLYDYARFPVREVASMVGCSEDTVKCRVYNGRMALCEGLDKRTPGDGELFRPFLDKLIRTCGKNCTLPAVVTERIREGIADGDAAEVPEPPYRAEPAEPKERAVSPLLINRICIVLGILFAAALAYILYWFLSSPKAPAADVSSQGFVSAGESSAPVSDPVSDVLSDVSGVVSPGEESMDTSSVAGTVSGDESLPEESSQDTSSATSSAASSAPTSTPTEESSQPPVLGELPRTTANLRLRSAPTTADPNNLIIMIPQGAHIDILETVTGEDGEKWYKARYTAQPGLWFDGYCSAAYVQTEE